MLAVVLSLELHVPVPVEAVGIIVNVVVDPVHIAVGLDIAVTAAPTVNVTDAEHIPDVNVITGLPPLIAVRLPLPSTEANAVLLLAHVPVPVASFKTITFPAQTV